jgi:hypothetical protein
MRRSVLVILVVSAAAAWAAAAEAFTTRITLEPLPGVSAGRVEGTRAFIALSLKGDRLRVYVCDGKLKRDPTISTWFKGRWDGRSALTLRAGGHTLDIDPVGDDSRVTGHLDGTRAFTVRPVKSPAGLFKGREGRIAATWIILPGREKRGTMVSTRKPCRFVLVTGPNGQQQWVSVCN